MKKIWKIVIAILLVIVIVLGVLYIIDTIRMEQNKTVLFSTWGKKYSEPIKDEAEDKEDNITEYSLEQAIKEGYFVVTNDKIYNKANLDRFIKNTNINAENRKEDNIKIVQYTREGDPIVIELSYKIKDETYLSAGKQVNKTTYILKVDNTRDRFAADKKITIDDDIPGEFYSIDEQKEGNTVNINLSLCAIIEYATSEAKEYETIHVCSYSENSEIAENQSFYGTVIESESHNIIVEPREGESIRKSADKISIDLGEYSDVVYMVGTNVKVTYTGDVMETYPAKVNCVKIELKSGESFELKFSSKSSNNSTKIEKILDKAETNKDGHNIYGYDYNIYSYNGMVNIVIDGKEIALRDALLENKIRMDEIIAKANQDEREGKIKANMYDDGGSIEYHYKDYTIIKVHKLDGNRDVYIGEPELNINDLKL